MTLQEQQTHFDAFINRQERILISKGNDYAGEDRLSNFKRAGAICGLTPAQNCLSLIATKVARLGVLLSGREPVNESVRDSIIDLANYAVLLDMIVSEDCEEEHVNDDLFNLFGVGL
jgi:hypothetical protein